MAREVVRLIFFKPTSDAVPADVGKQLADASGANSTEPLDVSKLLEQLRLVLGFKRLHIADEHFSFDNPRAEAAMEGRRGERHLDVRLYGNFERIARPLFHFMASRGLTCYSVQDGRVVEKWPNFDEPDIDKGYADRMQRVIARHAEHLERIEPDPKSRQKRMNAFVRSPEFHAEMEREHGQEKRRTAP